MTKVKHREVLVILLGAAGCLGGCETSTGFKKPALPENCYWLKLQYAWVCIPWDDGLRPGAPAPGASTEPTTPDARQSAKD